MSKLLLMNCNYYSYEDSIFNLKIRGNKTINFSKKYLKIFKHHEVIKITWEDKIRDITNNKSLFSDILSKDIHPIKYNFNEIILNKKYFVKKKFGSNGQNIFILKGSEIKKKDIENYIIQEYIEPDLISDKKYDIRLYYFVIRYKNRLSTWFSHNGKIRLCNEAHKDGGEICNSSLIENLPDEEKDKLQGNLSNLFLEDKTKIFNLMVEFDKQFKNAIRNNTNENYVNLYGIDIIKDINGVYKIIEANGNPSWQNNTDNKDNHDLKTKILDEILKILSNFFNNKNYSIINWHRMELEKIN